MTDYYPLLARAVAGLEKSTGEARRALYERARNALLAQLRGADPPLSESEITRERLALEEAVRRVEADAARQMRAAPPPMPERPATPPPPPRSEPEAPPPGRSSDERAAELRQESEGPRPPRAPPAEQPTRPDQSGLPGLRDVVAESGSLGSAVSQASRAARETYASLPSEASDLDRLEPRIEPEGLREPARGARPPLREPVGEGEPEADVPPPAELRRRRPPGPTPRRPVNLEPGGGHAARRGMVAALLTVLVIASLGATAYWQRDTISGWFGASRNGQTPRPRDQAQTRPKASDRVQQEGQAAQPQTDQPQATPGAPALVAQRVVLYEEDPANPQGNRYVGSALWRTETVSPGPGLSPELAIRADVEIPERRLAMTMSIRRNTDQALPASHTVEIIFNLPADFAFGGVANVPGLLMKEAEQARGAPLSGLAVKVTDGFFLIGLSAGEADLQRNTQLLKERSWFDIPMVYKNGRRAILAIEKGTPGERIFTEAFAAWAR